MIWIDDNCDGAGPHSGQETRRLPHGSEPGHGASLLCRSCYRRELAFRRERNKELGEFAQYDLPEWETLEIYATATA